MGAEQDPPVAPAEEFSWGQLAADVAVNPLTYLVAIAFCVAVVNRVGDSDSLLFVLAALPVAGLTALSKSSAGREIADKVAAELPGAFALSGSSQPTYAFQRAAHCSMPVGNGTGLQTLRAHDHPRLEGVISLPACRSRVQQLRPASARHAACSA